MARGRSKSKDAVLVESITGFIALGLLLWYVSPEFRFITEIFLLLAVITSLVIFGSRVCFKILRTEPASPVYKPASIECKTFTSYQFEPQIIIEPPKKVNSRAELTISEKLRKIDWFQFEKLIELIYLRHGFLVTRYGGANADGGIDLIVQSSTEKFIVQCKHWKKRAVSVCHMREFLGTLTDSKMPGGIYIALSGYTDEAKKLADKHDIQILNESNIIKMLQDSGLMYSEEVSKLFSDDRKFCPKCEKQMVLRTARVKGSQFWGCSSYPRCKFMLNCEA